MLRFHWFFSSVWDFILFTGYRFSLAAFSINILDILGTQECPASIVRAVSGSWILHVIKHNKTLEVLLCLRVSREDFPVDIFIWCLINKKYARRFAHILFESCLCGCRTQIALFPQQFKAFFISLIHKQEQFQPHSSPHVQHILIHSITDSIILSGAEETRRALVAST